MDTYELNSAKTKAARDKEEEQSVEVMAAKLQDLAVKLGKEK